LGERLMLKDKEVVSDPQRQYEIARTVHASQHGGINKTTATIAEKFHWVRIKETVSLVIKNCPDCKESAAKAPTVRPLGDVNGASPAQARRAAAAGGGGGMQVDPNSMIERLVCFDQMDQRPLVNVNGGNGNGVEAPNAVAAIPVAEMRALQRYGDIPLDPQIMGHPPPPPLSSSSDQQQYTHHHHQHPPPSYLRPTTTSNSRDHNATTFTPSTQLNGTRNPNIDPDMEIEIPPPHHSGVDTRMATDRHVREGDEPMAFQHSRGRVGEVRGRGQGDEMDLEELLGR